METLEDAQIHDKALGLIKGKNIYNRALEKEVGISSHLFETVMQKLVHDKYVNQKPASNGRKIYSLSSKGLVFMDRGGYTAMFQAAHSKHTETQKSKDETDAIERLKLRNDTLRTWATVGTFVIAAFGVYRAEIANTKGDQAQTHNDESRKLIDTLRHETNELRNQISRSDLPLDSMENWWKMQPDSNASIPVK